MIGIFYVKFLNLKIACGYISIYIVVLYIVVSLFVENTQ